jgi:hypothetical protein
MNTFKSGLKAFALFILRAAFALIGLAAMRSFLAGLNWVLHKIVIHETSLRVPFEGALGPLSSVDLRVFGVWVGFFLVLSAVCWFFIEFLGGQMTHLLPVLLATFLCGALFSYLGAVVGFTHWPVIVIGVFIAVVLFFLITKLFGYHKPGNWIEGKGKWLKKNAWWPMFSLVFIGFFAWPAVLLLLSWLLPGVHHWIMNDAAHWLMRWVWEPFWGALGYIATSFYQAFHH